MTTDELRRMLEMAAKAMGYVATESFRNGEFRVHDKSDQYWSFAWQPHTDDWHNNEVDAAVVRAKEPIYGSRLDEIVDAAMGGGNG